MQDAEILKIGDPAVSAAVIFADHAEARAVERTGLGNRFAEKLVMRSLTELSQIQPRALLTMGQIDVLDYKYKLFIGLYITGGVNNNPMVIRVQTLGKYGKLWPRNGNRVLKRHVNDVVQELTWCHQ